MAMTGIPPTTPGPADPQRLGCGRSIDEVWAGVDLPPDEHELTCPDCQAARADLGDLALATRAAVTADAADPTLRLDAGALTGILEIARAEVRRGRRIPMEQPLPGPAMDELMVSEQTLANLIRRVGDDVEGVEMRRCSVTLVPPGPEDLDGRPSEITVDLRVSVSATAVVPVLADRLRDRVREAVETQVGISVAVVDIAVEDVHHV